MNLTAIACMSRNRVIGDSGRIPWSCPEDLKFFREATMGHTVVMGRRTWESLPGGRLKGRKNLVLSTTLTSVEAPDVSGFIRHANMIHWFLNPTDKAFVIGGAEIYCLLMPWAREVLLTVLERDAEGDTFMPEFEDGFGEPEVIRRIEGVGEWRRYVRK